MDESEAADLGDAARRRRLKFRCWHRGMKEVDLILGRFADASVDGLDEEQLAAFEALLNEPDPQILAWVTRQETVPADHDTPFLRSLMAFHQ